MKMIPGILGTAFGLLLAFEAEAGAERTIFDMDEPATIQVPEPAPQKPLPKRPVAAVNSPERTAPPATRAVATTKPAATRAVIVRVKVPLAGELDAAGKMLEEVYGATFKEAKSAAERRGLAVQMRREGKSEPDAAARFMLYKKARDLAAEAGEGALVAGVVEDMEKAFEVKVWQLAAETIGPLGKTATTTLQKQALMELTGVYAVKAMEAEDFAAAKRMADAGAAAARGNKDPKAVKQANELVQGVREAEAAAAEVKKAGTGDAEANAKAGKYVCFYRGDWKRGLAKLAAGNDAGLAAAAKREMAGVGDGVEERIGLGDAWWDLAEKMEGLAKKRIREHAAGFYKRSLDKVSGLAKVKVTKRLADAGMEVLEVPDFVIAYLDSIADKLPKGDEPREEFRKTMAAAARRSESALRVNEQDRQLSFQGRILFLMVAPGGGVPVKGPSIVRWVGVRFEYHGMLVELNVREERKLKSVHDPIVAEWQQATRSGKIYVVESPASGFAVFTMLPAPDGRMRMCMSPIPWGKRTAVFSVRERD